MRNKSSLMLIGAIVLLLGSCKFEEKIKDGNTAYERKQYAKAIKLLKSEYNKTRLSSEKGDKAYKIGESYRLTYQPEKANEWYLKTLDAVTSVEAMRQYAYTLKQMERYDAAIRAFKDLGEEIGDPFEYQREIIACRQAKAWNKIKKKGHYQVELLDFNTKSADYYPVVYEDNKIVITSDRASSTGDKVYNWTGNDYSDLFTVDIETGAIESFSDVINSDYNEGTISFNKDFSQAIFTRCGSDAKEDVQYCKLFYSERVVDSWSKPEELPFTEAEINYGHPSLTPDGNTLYFACDHPDGLGGFDIYVVNKEAGEWTFPENVGSGINTEGNEISPYLDVDTLYFSSDKHVGMGGFDIFKSTNYGEKNWGPLQNLKSPVNSGADDFGFSIDYRKEIRDENVIHVGYFTSTRTEGNGNDDIYQFSKVIPPPEPEPVIDTTSIDTQIVAKPKIEYKMILEGRIVEKTYNIEGDPNSGVAGKTALGGASVQIITADTSFTIKPKKDGKFTIELDEQTNYNFFASKSEYLTNNASFSTRGIEKDPSTPIQKFSIEIVLDKVYKNVATVLPIFYDYNKWNIRPDARPILNDLATLLRQNPSINIELASHTDCRGDNDYNLSLSQKRAQSAVDYLVARGINESRLTARGYGENEPADNCACRQCSDDQHQANRRTTFAILDE